MKELTSLVLVLWNFYQGWQETRVRIKRFGKQRGLLCGRCIHSDLLRAYRKEYPHIDIPEGKLLKCDRCQALYVEPQKRRKGKSLTEF